MAGRNSIQVVLEAIDKLSPTLDKIKGRADTLGAGSVLLGNLYTKAFEVAASGVGAFTNAISQAADMQLEMVGTTSTFSALTGKSFGEAEGIVKGYNSEISKMAAALPGENSDFKKVAATVIDDVIPAFTDVNGAIDYKGLKTGLLDVTRGMTVIGVQSGIMAKDTAQFTQRFLAGNIASAKQLLFADNNPAFLSLVTKEAEKRGKTLEGLKDATNKERLEILNVVQKKLVTPESLKAATDSVAGVIAGLKSKYLDPTEGLLGMMRDVNLDLKGDQTVLSAVGKLLNATFGDNGVLATMGEVLTLAGFNLSLDPMKVLYDGITGLADWLQGVSDFMNKKNIPNIPKLDPGALGVMLAGVVNGLSASLLDSIQGINFAAIQSSISSAISYVFTDLVSFFTSLDWSVYYMAGAALLGVGLAGMLITVVGGAIAAMVAATAGLPVLVTIGAGLLIVAAGMAIVQNFDSMLNYCKNAFESLKNKAGDFFNDLGLAFIQTVDDTYSAITSSVGGFFENIKSGFSSLMERVASFFTEKLESIKSFMSNPLGGSSPTASSGVPHAAGGFNFGGLMGAINSEVQKMPSSASVLIANTSEAILNRGQQKELVSLVGSLAGAGGSSFSPQLNIYSQPGMDVNQLADLAISRMEEKYNQWQQSKM